MPTPRDSTPASPWATLLASATLAAGLGAAEAATRLLLELEPSLARRAPGLVGYAVVAYAGQACLAALGWRLLFRRRPSVLAPLAALAAMTLVLHGLGPRLDGASQLARGGALVASLVAAVLAGVVAARLTRRLRPRGPLLAGLGLAAGGLLVGLVVQARTSDPPALSPPPARELPDVLYVVVDTLRADVLSVYGGPVPTPNLERLAARGTLFEHAVAPASWTLPSVASILSGRYPRDHGVVDFDRSWNPDLASLPVELRRAGYHARAYVGNPFLGPSRRFDEAFDRYDIHGFEFEAELFLSHLVEQLLRLAGPLHTVPRGANPLLHVGPRFPYLVTRLAPNVHDRDLNARLLGAPWPADRPRFAYVQYVSPHRPYLEQPYRFLKRWTPFVEGQRERLVELYRGEVAAMDAALGELLAGFDPARTLVVVTADHGEAFLEHGHWEHGYDLYEEAVHVPLLLAGPGVPAGARVPRPVSLVDLAPTTLALLGLPPAPEFTGAPLLPAPGAAAGSAPIVFSETVSRFLTPEEDWFAAIEGPWKVIHRMTPDGELRAREVYQLERDPGETAPSSDPPEEPPVVRRLDAALEEFRARRTASSEGALSPEELERMDALGYTGEGGDDDREP